MTSQHLLLKNIAKFVKLTAEEERKLLDSFTVEKHPARTVLLNEGEICRDNIFVLSGILRNYTLDDDLHEHTMSFATSGWWMGDMYSFLSQKPGDSFIEVVEDAEVLRQSRQQQLEIFDEIPKMERFYRILIERSLVANQQRLLDNMRLSAEERYHKFTDRYADIVYRLPQKDIASYIGVTPQFFSKMKRRILKGE